MPRSSEPIPCSAERMSNGRDAKEASSACHQVPPRIDRTGRKFCAAGRSSAGELTDHGGRRDLGLRCPTGHRLGRQSIAVSGSVSRRQGPSHQHPILSQELFRGKRTLNWQLLQCRLHGNQAKTPTPGISWSIYGPSIVSECSFDALGSHPCRAVSVSYEQMLGCHGILGNFWECTGSGGKKQ